MAYLTTPYILYSIKTNIFLQSLKSKELMTAWTESKNYLKNFTSADIYKPWFINLKIYPIFDRKKIDKNLEEVLSISERPTLEPIWNVANDNLEKVIQGLDNLQDYMPTKPNAIVLSIWYDFKLLDAASLTELPNQEGSSYIKFVFSKKHSCSPCLLFPFSDPTSEFWLYLDTIKLQLPFVLEEKLLRKTYVRNGHPSAFKKIARPI
jgi:hypothetical protein